MRVLWWVFENLEFLCLPALYRRARIASLWLRVLEVQKPYRTLECGCLGHTLRDLTIYTLALGLCLVYWAYILVTQQFRAFVLCNPHEHALSYLLSPRLESIPNSYSIKRSLSHSSTLIVSLCLVFVVRGGVFWVFTLDTQHRSFTSSCLVFFNAKSSSIWNPFICFHCLH